MEIKVISSDSLRSDAKEKMRSGIVPIRDEMINLVMPSMKIGANNEEKFNAA